MGQNGSKLGLFGPKWRHRPKFRESGQIFFSLKVFKNNSNQVYGHKFGHMCHKWDQFGQNRSFFVKMVQNWVILGAKWRHRSKFRKEVED